MKYKTLFMFLILQVLLVITNYQDVNQTLLSFDLIDILKVLISTFSLVYILFSVKNNYLKKILYSSVLFLTVVIFLIKKYPTGELLTNIY